MGNSSIASRDQSAQFTRFEHAHIFEETFSSVLGLIFGESQDYPPQDWLLEVLNIDPVLL